MANLEDLRIDSPVPKPRRSRPSPLPWLIVVGLVLWLIWRFGGDRVQQMASAVQPAREVEVYSVPSQRGPEGSFTAGGYLEVIPPGPMIASALIDGQVRELLVKPGDSVKQGQLIARLDGSLLAADVSVQRSEVQLAEANLARMKSGFRSEEIAQARAALGQAQSRLAKAQADYARFSQLFGEGIVSRAEFDIYEATLKQAEGDVESHQAALDMQIAGQRDVDITIASRQVDAARAQLRRSQAVLGKTAIHAPTAGVVLEVFVQPGGWVSPSDSMDRAGQICSIFDPKQVQAWSDVNQRDIARVYVGMPVTLATDVRPDEPLRGRVSAIMPSANLSKNTVQVKVTLDHPAEYLRPETSAQITFMPKEDSEDSAPKGVSIPSSAVVRDGARATVFLVVNGVAEVRAIDLGAASGDNVLVLSGVAAGDQLVANATGIRAGQTVKIKTEEAKSE
ncbi:MAG: efflux RND transporter periplasmic adaptor subunit [bacterium]|nr:efflux RND transporter periplasmic adaptor subunit [bacterium]